MVDAHEQERNTQDFKRSFYQRAGYVYANYLRYQNDTLCNLMFDTQLRRIDYDKLNSVSQKRNLAYYVSMTGFHSLTFMYMAFFFRFRRVSLLSTAAISSAYYFFFTKVNNIAYKVIVDAKIISTARELGQD